MKEEVSWHIGKSANGFESLEERPWTANIFLKESGHSVAAWVYTVSELETEIKRGGHSQELKIALESALRDLQSR